MPLMSTFNGYEICDKIARNQNDEIKTIANNALSLAQTNEVKMEELGVTTAENTQNINEIQASIGGNPTVLENWAYVTGDIVAANNDPNLTSKVEITPATDKLIINYYLKYYGSTALSLSEIEIFFPLASTEKQILRNVGGCFIGNYNNVSKADGFFIGPAPGQPIVNLLGSTGAVMTGNLVASWSFNGTKPLILRVVVNTTPKGTTIGNAYGFEIMGAFDIPFYGDLLNDYSVSQLFGTVTSNASTSHVNITATPYGDFKKGHDNTAGTSFDGYVVMGIGNTTAQINANTFPNIILTSSQYSFSKKAGVNYPINQTISMGEMSFTSFITVLDDGTIKIQPAVRSNVNANSMVYFQQPRIDISYTKK